MKEYTIETDKNTFYAEAEKYQATIVDGITACDMFIGDELIATFVNVEYICESDKLYTTA